jgi:hypothetical protein
MLPGAFALVAVSLAVTAVFPHADARPAEVTRRIDVALESLSSPPPTCDNVRRGMLAILEAVERASDAGDQAHHTCGARAAVAGLRLAHGSLVDPQTVALMGECHRELHDGAPFTVPPDVRSAPDAIDAITRQLELARRLAVGPRPWEATSPLIDAVLLIVTPMER